MKKDQPAEKITMETDNQNEETQPLLAEQSPTILASGSGPDQDPEAPGRITCESSRGVELSTTQTGEENEVSTLKVVAGIILVIAAGLSFTASNIIQKFYIEKLTFLELLFYRGVVQTALLFWVCIFKGYQARYILGDIFLGPPGFRCYNVTQGVLVGLLLLCMFNAINQIPLENSSAIMYFTPVFTFILAPCMLREDHCGLYRSLVALFMVIGVVLITRPTFIFNPDITPDTNSTIPDVSDFDGAEQDFKVEVGYFCAVGVPILSAFTSILTHQCKHIPIYMFMFWIGVGSLIAFVGSFVMLRSDHLLDIDDLELIPTFSTIALGIFGNLCYTFAVRWVSPSKANVFRSFEVILYFGLQLHFEHTKFYPENAVGIFLLMGAVIIMAFETVAYKKFNNRFL